MTIESKTKGPASFAETAHKEVSATLQPENDRYASVQAINPNDENAIHQLIELMGDPSWRVRKASVEKVESFEHSSTLIAALTEGLSADNNARVRNTAAEALVKIGPRALEHLVVALATADSSRRKFIVEVPPRARGCVLSYASYCYVCWGLRKVTTYFAPASAMEISPRLARQSVLSKD